MTDGRVVVFRPGALGDTIVTVDALAALRTHFPYLMIELVGNAPAARLLQGFGLIDVATPFDSLDVAPLFAREPRVVDRWRSAALVVLWLPNASAIVEAFREAGAEAIVAASPHPTRASGASPASPRGRGEDTHPTRAFGASPASPRGRGEGSHPRRASGASATSPTGRKETTISHISDFLLETLRPVGIAPVTAGPTLIELPSSHGRRPTGRNALLHPGSGSPHKNWPPDHFAELARRLRYHGWIVRLLRGPADAEAVEAVSARVGADTVSIEEPTDISALATLLAVADLYVGNDSGVSHLSGRLGVPTVAIFGASDPRVWAPRGFRVSVVDGRCSWPTVDCVWDAGLRFVRGSRERTTRPPATERDARAFRGRTPRRRE